MSVRHHPPRVTATASVIGLIALALLSGCTLVRTVPPKAAPGSPAASGPSRTPYVASEEIGAQLVPLAGKVEPPKIGAYQGVYAPPAPFNNSNLDRFETMSGKRPTIVMWYQPWAANNRSEPDVAACLAIMRRGAVPMITWEPWDPGSNANLLANPADQWRYRLSEVSAGYHDEYIHSWAKQLKQLGGPVMLRPLHEMNGTWYPWGGTVNGNTPAEYVEVWRRMHDIFEQEGATNVTWVWSVNAESVPNTAENAYSSYYPGDAYVDWTAISGFNWGTSDPKKSGWRTWDQDYTTPLAYLATLGKPICLAEMASVEQGGNKAAWIRDAYTQIPKHPQIKAVVYYDSLEERPANTQDWQIDSSPASLDAFRAAIAASYFTVPPPQTLSDWAAKLTTTDWTYLGALVPRY